MTWEYLPGVLTAITGVLVAFGGGVKWMLTRMDAHDHREREWQAQERSKLEEQFNQRISSLTDRVERQDAEIAATKSELRAYIRHVGILEGLLKANGVDVPTLELPK